MIPVGGSSDVCERASAFWSNQVTCGIEAFRYIVQVDCTHAHMTADQRVREHEWVDVPRHVLLLHLLLRHILTADTRIAGFAGAFRAHGSGQIQCAHFFLFPRRAIVIVRP